MKLIFDESYWTTRWNNKETGWDIGHVSTPLKAYFDQLIDKELHIVIPGAGNAYEAEYLHSLGFKNVFVVDLSQKALDSFYSRVPSFNSEHLICEDFFNLKANQFDLMVEQTFFCALHPSERPAYCNKAAKILKPNGKLIGLLFQVPLFEDHPPFGGKKEEYLPLFSNHFEVELMETAHNSIGPRANNELFIKLIRK
ncbi:MAG: methyltransferase domain-containing protein [Salibacteraceae bacterium]